MRILTQQRPDITAVVHDLSAGSTRFAEEQFGLSTITGDLSTLETHNSRYDVIVLSDVLYYEPRIANLWRVLSQLLAPGGSIVIRVPNKLLLIRTHQAFVRFARLFGKATVQDGVRYFNPEHVYVLSRRYLTRRLAKLGFTDIRVVPSPPLLPSSSSRKAWLAKFMFRAANVISTLSGRHITASPSMLIVCRGRGAA
jgi:SAM-dependent methyltransferase